MQGQGSTSNAFPGTFYLDYGSNAIDLRLDQNNVVPADASFRDSHPAVGWRGESSSRVNTQTPIWFQDLLAEDGLLSSPHAGSGTGQRLEERNSEPNIAPFQQSVNMSLGNGELTKEQSVLHGPSSSSLPHKIDLNATYEGNGIDGNQDMGAGLCLNPFKPGGFDAVQIASASDSSNSNALVISSGIAGYVLEESEGGEGPTSDGRRLSCKRRAPDDVSGRLHLGESSKSAKQAGSSQQQAIATQGNAHTSLNISTPMNDLPNFSYSEQMGAGLVVGLEAPPVIHQPSCAAGSGLVARAGASSGMHLPSSVVGQAEHSQRNIHLRRSANQLDFMPPNLPFWTTRNPHVQSPGQPPALFPFDHPPNTSSAAGLVNSAPPMQPRVCVPNSSQSLQPFQWNGVTRSRTNVPSSSAYTLNGGDAFRREENSRDHLRNGMLANLAYVPTNLNFANGASFPGNIASSSQNGSSSNVHQPFVPSWLPQGNIAEQYAQRVSDIVNRIESRGQGSYCPMHIGAPAARERELSPRSGNARHLPFPMPLRAAIPMRADRQTGGHPELALRPLTAAQRRSRLVSEVCTID